VYICPLTICCPFRHLAAPARKNARLNRNNIFFNSFHGENKTSVKLSEGQVGKGEKRALDVMSWVNLADRNIGMVLRKRGMDVTREI
jgi:hypothetical protein